jgi:hypothetical protein
LRVREFAKIVSFLGCSTTRGGVWAPNLAASEKSGALTDGDDEMIGVVCNSQRRFETWCRKNPGLAGAYNSVSGKAAHACRISTSLDFLQHLPASLIYLEPTFDFELASLLVHRDFEDRPPVSNRKRPGRPAKSQKGGTLHAK